MTSTVTAPAVLLCVDHGFTVPLAVCLASLDAAGSGPVVAHVAHPGIAADVRARIAQPLRRVHVVWHRVDLAPLRGAHHSVFLSPASLYRLLLASVLPAELDRVVYLDADTVVRAPLDDLFDEPLGGRILAAVREAQSPWAAGPLGPPWRELGLDPATPYFNSGVLVVDLAAWRRHRVGERCLDLLREQRPRWGDQDALNTVVGGAWHELPRRYNLQTADVRGDAAAWALWPGDVQDAVARPAVVHFTERDKPWHPGSQHPLASLWFEQLDTTAWAGWRPAPPARSWTDPLRAAVREARGRRDRRRTAIPLTAGAPAGPNRGRS